MKGKDILNLQNHFFELSQDLLCIVGFEGNFITINPAWENILGYTEKEILTKPFLEFIHPDDHQKTSEELSNTLKGKTSHKFENRYNCKDGTIKYFKWTLTPDVKEKIFYATGRDITEQKKAENNIVKTKLFYEDIIEQVQEGIWVTNEKDIIYFANKGMEKIAGIPHEKIEGNNVLIDFPEETTGELIAYYKQAKEEKRPIWYEIRVKTPAGKDTWQNGWLIPKYEDNAFKGIICTIRDVTKQNQTEKALKANEEKFRLIDNATVDYIFSQDIDGRFTHANPSLLNFFELPIDQILGKTYRDLNYPEEFCLEWDKLNAEVFEKKSRVISESSSPDRLGNIRYMEVVLDPLHNTEGEIIGIAGVARDLTDKRKAEKDLRASEEKYRSLYDNINVGVALHEIVLDSSGKAIDFIFLDANHTYEKLTTLKKADIVGKYGSDVIPNLEQKWIDLYGKVALTGEAVSIIDHSSFLDKYWEVRAYSPAKNQFAVALTDITDRINAERMLKTSEERLRAIIDSSPFPIAVVDINTKTILHWSKSAKKLFGHNPKTSNEWNQLAYPDPNYRNKVIERWKPLFEIAVKSSKVVYAGEYRIVCKDSSVKTCELYTQVIHNNLIITTNDITERKRSEIELIKAKEEAEENEAKYRSLIYSSPMGILFYKLENNKLILTGANPSVKRMLGIIHDDLIGKTIEEAFPNLTQTNVPEMYKQVARGVLGHQSFEIPYQDERFSGFYKVDVFSNQPKTIVVHFMDITEIKNAEIEIRKAIESVEESKANITAIIEGSNNSIWAFNKNFELLYLNQKFQEEFLLSFGVHLKPGVNIIKAHPETIRDLWKSRYSRALNNEQFMVEDAVPTEKGTIYVQVSFNPIIKNGEIIGVSCLGSDISERKQAELKLKASEAKYKELFVKMMNAFALHEMIFDEKNEPYDYRFLEVNPAWEKLVGINSKMVINKTIREIMPDIEEVWIETYGKVVKTGVSIEFEDYNNATKKYYHIYAYRTEPGKFAVLFNDITERKQAEEAFIKAKEITEETNANITAILEGGNDSIWAFNKNYEILYINRTFQAVFLEFFGTLLEPGVNIIESLPKAIKPIWKSSYDRVLADEQFKIEDTVLGENGTRYMQISFNPIVKNGEVIGGSCVASNITERKKNEIELIKAKEKAEESEAILKAAMENSQAGIAIADYPSGRLTYVNKAGLLIRDKDYDSIVKNIDINKYVESWQILHFDGIPFETNKVPLARAVLYGETNSAEFIVRRDNNEDRYVWANAAPIINEKGKQIAAIVIFLDITETKLAEFAINKSNEELIKAKQRAEESDRLKSAFLANMSHEIRTPLNGILGFTELLVDEDLDVEQKNEMGKIILENGELLLTIINDVLDISKIEAGQIVIYKSKFKISKAIIEVVNSFKVKAQKKNLELRIAPDNGTYELEIYCDFIRLKQVLTNLVSNAIKYTDEGFIEVGCKRTKNEFVFFVADSGMGIEKKQHKRIFERFNRQEAYTKKAGGNGLGLAISKSFVEMFGGKIWVESELGKGSNFYFTIPFD